jgi:hypothetical protein
MAATPEHPVILGALELGAAAINRDDTDLIWLSAGPGLLTRAFAQVWAEQRAGGLLRRTQMHCNASSASIAVSTKRRPNVTGAVRHSGANGVDSERCVGEQAEERLPCCQLESVWG